MPDRLGHYAAFLREMGVSYHTIPWEKEDEIRAALASLNLNYDPLSKLGSSVVSERLQAAAFRTQRDANEARQKKKVRKSAAASLGAQSSRGKLPAEQPATIQIVSPPAQPIPSDQPSGEDDSSWLRPLMWTSHPDRYPPLRQKGLSERLIPSATKVAALGGEAAAAVFRQSIPVMRRQFFWPKLSSKRQPLMENPLDALVPGDEIYIEAGSPVKEISGPAFYRGPFYDSKSHSSHPISTIAAGDKIHLIWENDLREGIMNGTVSRLASTRTLIGEIRQGDILAKKTYSQT
jgi:hypothetical protein